MQEVHEAFLDIVDDLLARRWQEKAEFGDFANNARVMLFGRRQTPNDTKSRAEPHAAGYLARSKLTAPSIHNVQRVLRAR